MILVDDRVGSVDLEVPLRDLCRPTPVVVQRLQFADFAFAAEHGPDGEPSYIGIERKKVRELVADIDEGRFAGNQMKGLLNRYDFVYLIVEGWYRRNNENGNLEVPNGRDNRGKTRWSGIADYRKLDSHLHTLRLMTGVHVIKAQRWEDTVMEIHLLHHWFAKPWELHGSHLRFPVAAKKKPNLSTPSFTRRVAKELPDIGWERSSTVEQLFPTVRDMGNSNQDRWELIDGIGPGRAARIIRYLRGEEKEKGVYKP